MRKESYSFLKMVLCITFFLAITMCLPMTANASTQERNAAFQSKLDELIDTYGIFEENQKGTMCAYTDNWFNPTGVISAMLLDFDSDDEEEMLVCYPQKSTSQTSSSGSIYEISVDMYEYIDGAVFLADQLVLGAFMKNEHLEIRIALNVLLIDDKYYMMFEWWALGSSYSDGRSQDYQVVYYSDGIFKDECAFLQTGGGSIDFAFTGYEYEDGKLIKSNLYYDQGAEWNKSDPLYENFTTAIRKFFGQYGIDIKSNLDLYSDVRFGSILSDKNNKIRVFEFKNERVSEETIFLSKKPPYSFYHKCQFQATLKTSKPKNNLDVYVTAIDKSTNKEVPVPNAEVYLYVGEEERGYYTTDSDGYVEIPLDHLTEKEIQKATVSAKKIVSRGKAINGTARDELFEHFPKDEYGDYYRYTMELHSKTTHSETIDDAGNWVGAAIPEVDKFSLTRELKLELSEPRMLVNLAVCYFADDETSQSREYVMSVMEMLNQYSHRLAEATDAHIMIDKILLFSTDDRYDFYFREGETPNIASMADMQIQAEVDDPGSWGLNIKIHNAAGPFGFYSSEPIDVSESDIAKFKHIKEIENNLAGKKRFARIITSGIDINGNSMLYETYNYSLTQTHETGHYLLGLYDEYLDGTEANWSGRLFSKPYNGNFGLMDNQYKGFELSRNSVQYSYMHDDYLNVDQDRHTWHSWLWKCSCEDSLEQWFSDEGKMKAILRTVFEDENENYDYTVGQYKSSYSKVKGTDDHTATYWYAELDDSDFLTVPSHDMNTVSVASNENFETTDLEESNKFLASSSAVLAKELVADVSFTSTSSALKVTVKGNNGISYTVSYRKAGEDSFRTAKLTNGTASLNIAKGELAEVRISDGENYNCYYIERTPDTDTGYIYTSADNAVMAYVANDTDDSYTFIADNTDYTNGSYISMNQATWLGSDSGKAFDSGEIYSVASYMAEIDYTTLTWFKYADGKWSALATDYSTEENRNIGARADLDGAGMYVLMAKSAGGTKALPAKYLKYQQSEDRDAVVTLTFNDPNTTSKYYNVYYSDEPLTDKDADSVVVRSFDADSPKLTLNLLERGRTVYAAVEIVLEDGSRSPLSEITLTGGEADSDGDGIPDWYCNLHQLWGENGENKDVAGSDDDGDGLTNLEEYQKGTDPKYTDDIVKNTKVVRYYGATRYETSYAIAAALKRQMGVERFSTVIIANGKNFPDALAGSYLAGIKDAPILMANEKYKDSLQSYIKANLKAGGTIYVLGGTAAVPGNVLNGLSGYDIKRLAGKNRYETNLLILEEAGVDGGEILICTGSTFADSLSASATGKPILLVKNKELTDGQLAFLKKHAGSQFYIIGGEGAVSRTIENAIKKYGTTKRIYGDSRYETSVEVAKAFFKTPDSAVLAYAKNFPDGLSGGPLVTEMNAPLILTSTGKIDAAAGYVSRYNIDKGFVLGGSSLISDAAVQKIF